MDYLNQLIFGVLPYVAGAVFIVGSLLRYERGQYTWRAMSSQPFTSGPAFRWASIAFHVGVLLIFFGHLFGLLTPKTLYEAIGLSSPIKQLGAIIAGGVFGLMCFCGLTYLLYRRLFNARVRANSAPMDTFIITLLYLQVITGLSSISVSKDHLDGTVMVLLATWAQHIVTFRADAWTYVVNVHWIYRLHMFLGFIMFTAFPFSRLVHIWSWPVEYAWRRYQVVRSH